MKKEIKQRLAELKQAIKEENISYGEIAELEELQEYIDPNDTELLQWAGVKEFPVTFRIYIEPLKETFIDIEAKSEKEAVKLWNNMKLKEFCTVENVEELED